ncbi:hypothetical protein C8F04DRAFT_1183106 [Mycena alexandri]|uniref:Uncharacterized protein n=1 Tax=Mycena alexandri TaxID=1745969 RepID=A0AAD6SV02_9AGAR|nr:hypothetical protein C8F04DRAFT_1183106 [Mycena alexandri]
MENEQRPDTTDLALSDANSASQVMSLEICNAALPTGIPSNADLTNGANGADGAGTGRSLSFSDASHGFRPLLPNQPGSFFYQHSPPSSMSAPHLPLPVTASSPSKEGRDRWTSFVVKIPGIPERAEKEKDARDGGRSTPSSLMILPPTRLNSPTDEKNRTLSPPMLSAHKVSSDLQSSKSMRLIRSPHPGEPQKIILARTDEAFLLPDSLPPKYHLFDLFPFSLLVRCLTKHGCEVKGKKAARVRAKLSAGSGEGSHNLPLEVSLYLGRACTSRCCSTGSRRMCLPLIFSFENNLLFPGDPNVDERVGPVEWVRREAGRC